MTGVRHWIQYLFLVCLGSLVVACSGIVGNSAPSIVETPTEQFQVAILLPGPKQDQGWSQMGYTSGQLIQKKLSASVQYSDNVKKAEQEQQFRNYAKAGVDFIVGFGGEFIKAATTVAKEFPRIRFAVVGSEDSNNRNLGTITVNSDESGYLAGAIAAIKTKTNKVALVGGEIYPHTERQSKQFVRGAQSIHPEIITKTEWVHSWDDVEKGKAVGAALIREGFDVIAVNADLAGVPIHTLAQKAGVKTIGWAVDQNNLAPDTVLSSMVEDFSVAVLKAATLAQTGRWEGKQYKFGLQEGVNAIAPFHQLLSETEIAQIETIKKNNHDRQDRLVTIANVTIANTVWQILPTLHIMAVFIPKIPSNINLAKRNPERGLEKRSIRKSSFPLHPFSQITWD
ncbi:MAG: BMP family ABC transporter substrate-binding protein [Leptolyngbyaceae cyanobacterium CRU_2_3]|nr:BMP family ABC transporter substrate-binding protein [Leptolyngbyaceae cyanobacterium CRU_2_3]